ncbi:MAG: hypothetical protein PHQ23_11375 [Candidatus Wallbacteria bacterium]|nr:hypothetical protein [Candidatus Wallbacteria bacterium]
MPDFVLNLELSQGLLDRLMTGYLCASGKPGQSMRLLISAESLCIELFPMAFISACRSPGPPIRLDVIGMFVRNGRLFFRLGLVSHASALLLSFAVRVTPLKRFIRLHRQDGLLLELNLPERMPVPDSVSLFPAHGALAVRIAYEESPALEVALLKMFPERKHLP